MHDKDLEKIAMDILLSAFQLKLLDTLVKQSEPVRYDDLSSLAGFNNIDPTILIDSLQQLIKDDTIERTTNDRFRVSDYGNKVYNRIATIKRTVPRI